MSPRPEFDILAHSALALAEVEPDVGHEFFGPLEAAHLTNNGQERGGVDEAHAEDLQAAQHHGLRAHLGSNEPVEALAALFGRIRARQGYPFAWATNPVV
jgi:hypothetical protein